MIVCGFFVACDLKGDFIALWEPVFWRWRPYRRPCFGWLCEYPFLRVLRLAVPSGIDPGASSPVCFAAPPFDVFGFAKRSLRSHPRINPGTKPADAAGESRSKAAAELTLILLSGEGQR